MNKIALVTGASRGLGRNTALHLAAQGIDIIGTYHSKADEAHALVAELEQKGVRATMLQLDVSNSASFEAFAATGTTTVLAYGVVYNCCWTEETNVSANHEGRHTAGRDEVAFGRRSESSPLESSPLSILPTS